MAFFQYTGGIYIFCVKNHILYFKNEYSLLFLLLSLYHDKQPHVGFYWLYRKAHVTTLALFAFLNKV